LNATKRFGVGTNGATGLTGFSEKLRMVLFSAFRAAILFLRFAHDNVITRLKWAR